MTLEQNTKNSLALNKDETRGIVTSTVNEVYAIVTSTMSPNGNVVVYAEGTSTQTTKDGATVAGVLQFDNPHAERINRIIEEAARKTEVECGDGTTTTIFLMKHLYDLLVKYPGFNNFNRIEKLIKETIDQLKTSTIQVDVNDPRLEQLAITTANQDVGIAKLCLDVYKETNGYPIIEFFESTASEDRVVKAQGQSVHMRLADANFTPYGNGADTEFVNMVFGVVNTNLFFNNDFSSNDALETLRSLNNRFPKNRIGIVAPNTNAQFINIINQINFSLQEQYGSTKFVIFTTGTGGSIGSAILGDVATILNAPVLSSFKDLESVDLNVCKEKIISSISQSIIKSVNKATQTRIDKRAADIETSLDSLGSERRYSPFGRSTLKRLHNLRSEIVSIYVGGETPNEVKERKDRFEDVALAIKSGLENGILPGCGIALRNAVWSIASQYNRETLLSDYVTVCFKQWDYLTKEMGIYPVGHDFNGPNGYDVLGAMNYGDIINLATLERGTPEELGVYDTAYAAITALKGAFSTAKILANTSSIILGSKAGAIHFNK